jgi:formate-dependent nitrite reductase cytochrome c552 subunit
MSEDIELAEMRGDLAAIVDNRNALKERLTAAELRNATIVGKADKCKECGSDALFWFSSNTNTSGIAEGRLRTNEVTCTFVLGCADCSATIKTVRADTIAERMTAALKPTESGASE